VDPELVDDLFSKPDIIGTPLLMVAATHRSPAVRRRAVPILVARTSLSPDIAEQLLSDTDAVVRYFALRSLINGGREYTDEKAKSVLVRPTGRAGLGLLSFGMGGTVPDNEGEAQFKKFSTERLRAFNEAALERVIANETLFDRDARFARDFKQFSTRGTALRAAVDDQFKTLLSADIGELEERFGADSETVKKLQSVEETIRKKFCRQALDIICEKNQAEDLARVRHSIKQGFIDYSDLDVAYLRHHGEWQDVKLLISLLERRSQSFSLLMGVDDSTIESVASALISISRGRLAELIKMEMPYRLLTTIIRRTPDAEVGKLSNGEITSLLMSEIDQIRKTTALKAIRSFPKRRIKLLLRQYVDHDGQRYYNVIYWLDFGISLPRVRVLQATRRVLARD
jgi:hypothetical protein